MDSGVAAAPDKMNSHLITELYRLLTRWVILVFLELFKRFGSVKTANRIYRMGYAEKTANLPRAIPPYGLSARRGMAMVRLPSQRGGERKRREATLVFFTPISIIMNIGLAIIIG
jgi:hypothetical protein